ncbi:hypothetical protein FRB94_000236 [Tulasnella sp. JGI-2019a]|nr:hypothetical protein FRB94_000236 [Tulasnella sp. JGI-2019a]KAG9015306.1 hypothetical protein FRB93_013006 [Tulasnella sp. JGI-2019a]KAG9039389.1 hypothetical protein FRB95_010677 [Tulasnella sp. JGI-2019a]
MPSLILSRGTPEPTWEIVDHQEISAVPIYYGDSEFEIISVSLQVVSRTYTFNAPSASSTSSRPVPPLLPPKPHQSATSSPRRRSTLIRSSFLPCPFRRASSTSNQSSEDEASSHELPSDYATSMPSSSPSDTDGEEKHISIRDAVIFARQQLLTSSDFKRVGGNVFYTEGWSVTRLRKGNQHRLQVRYFGRPAHVAFLIASPSIPSSQPPFIEMLQGSWY